MSEAAPAIETPTDSPEPKPPKANPNAGNRYRLFDDGDGDYRIFEIAPEGAGVPKGALLPITDVPGFENTYLAKKFVRESGERLQGKQLMVFKGIDICSVQVQKVATTQVKFKPKTLREGSPKGSAGEGGE